MLWILTVPHAAAAPIPSADEPPLWTVALADKTNPFDQELPAEPEPKSEDTNKPARKATGDTVYAFITGYNTVPEQTDSTPCLAAGGNICGRDDVVACPTYLPLHSWVRIDGKEYECMDRTHSKYDGRFDISCDKDYQCALRQTRWTNVELL